MSNIKLEHVMKHLKLCTMYSALFMIICLVVKFFVGVGIFIVSTSALGICLALVYMTYRNQMKRKEYIKYNILVLICFAIFGAINYFDFNRPQFLLSGLGPLIYSLLSCGGVCGVLLSLALQVLYVETKDI